jgi:hypothetical protein
VGLVRKPLGGRPFEEMRHKWKDHMMLNHNMKELPHSPLLPSSYYCTIKSHNTYSISYFSLLDFITQTERGTPGVKEMDSFQKHKEK